jgi:hypothetical protein
MYEQVLHSYILTAASMIQIIAFIFLTGLIIWKVFFPVPRPILGVYSRAGKRGIFKQWSMYLLLKWRKRSASGGKKEVGYGLKMTEDVNKLECVKVFKQFIREFITYIL